MTQCRTSYEAVANYITSLQKLVPCVTPSVITAELHQLPPAPHSFTINDGEPVLLSGPSRLQLALRQYFVNVDSAQSSAWQIQVSSYFYELLDSDGREVLAYHWHPRGNSPVPTPHLHLEQGAQVGRTEVRDAHLPTGDVSMEAILRVLIEEMGVRPLRPDWESILS